MRYLKGDFVTMKQRTGRHVWSVLLAVALTAVGVAAALMLFQPPVSAQDESLCDVVDGATLEALIEEGVCSSLGVPVIESATGSASGEIEVTWTPGRSAVGNLLLLFTSDFVGDPVAASKGASDTTHTFENLAEGDYVLVVASYNADVEIQLAITTVSVPGS